MRKTIMGQLAVATLLWAASTMAASQDSGLDLPKPHAKPQDSATLATDDLNRRRFFWEGIASWPSPELMESMRGHSVHRPYPYLGPYDKMTVNYARGTVEAWLADASVAGDFRCKYELAGFAEISRQAPPDALLPIAHELFEQCHETARQSRDPELLRQWRDWREWSTAKPGRW